MRRTLRTLSRFAFLCCLVVCPECTTRAQVSEGQIKRIQSGRKQMRQKLSTMIVEDVSFTSAPFGAIVDYISDQARNLDKEKKGVNFISNAPEGVADSVHVTLKLRNVPLIEVLKYAC